MDPLSVAGSVVGLIAAGAQLIPQLYNLSSAIKDAPQQARAAVSELGDITIVLTQLQKYIDGRAQASTQRLNLITVEHITASLTECVMTYSELDAILKSLHADQGLKVWDRAVWFVKKDEVGQIIVRLQNHKSTFGLMLNIIQCASINEAENNMDRLCDMVNELLQSNRGLWLKLRNVEDAMSKRGLGTETAVAGASDQASQSSKTSSISVSVDSGGATHSPSRVPVDDEEDLPKASAFEELLHRSRVYRHASSRHSETSLVDDGRSSLAMSICSSFTLGEVSRISVYALPVYADELSNAECYNFQSLLHAHPHPSSQPPGITHRTPEATSSSKESRAEQWQNLRTTRNNFKRLLKPNSSLANEQPPVFGVALETSIRCANVVISLYDDEGQSNIFGYLPIIVAKCGVLLKERAEDTSGIFSTASSPKNLQELKAIFERPPRYGKRLDWSAYSAVDAGNLLLRYLLQLPEPVIPHALYGQFRAPFLSATPDPNQEPASYTPAQVNTLKQDYEPLINDELPPTNRQLLLYLLDMLSHFGHYHFKDPAFGMSALESSGIFQPAILSHPDHRLVPAENSKNRDVLLFLIKFQDEILESIRGGAGSSSRLSSVRRQFISVDPYLNKV